MNQIIDLCKCKICNNLLNNPHSTSCTNLHTFCFNCIKNQTKCPTCNSTIKSIKRNISICQIITAITTNADLTEIFKCPICEQTIQNPHSATCNELHSYCYFCINKWLTKEVRCPTCVTELVIDFKKNVLLGEIINMYTKKID